MSKLFDNLSNLTHTDNGAMAFESTTSKVLDFWNKACAFDTIHNHSTDRVNLPTGEADDAFDEDRDLAVRALLNAYDVRGGAGRRDIFLAIFYWWVFRSFKLNSQQAIQIINQIPNFGRFDMLWKLALLATNEHLFTKEHPGLGREFTYACFSRIAAALDNPQEAALCAKWLPRKGIMANRIRGFLKLTPKEYRKKLAAYSTVETQMSSNDWDKIDYEKIPSVATLRHRNAFLKHDHDRYSSYLSGVVAGTAKMHQTVTYPYDIVGQVRHGSVDGTAGRAAWKALLDNVDYDRSVNILPIVDVSGSMTCPATYHGIASRMDVSISLGLYLAQTNQGMFRNEVVTFSESPEFLKLPDDFIEAVDKIDKSSWGMNTDFEKVFSTMLTRAKAAQIPDCEMPKVIIAISDMQFDEAGNLTGYEMIRKQYQEAGYTMPLLVFWNLDSDLKFPTLASQPGVVMVSGFSPNMIKPILEGDFNAITPQKLMEKVLSDERYNVVKW